MWEPPSTMHREVIQTPSSMSIRQVMSAMSLRWRWLPVVRKDSCEITTSDPTRMIAWLSNHTPSPVHDRSPISSFQGSFTLVRGRKITPVPIFAPKARSTRTRSDELIRHAFVTKTSSASDHTQ